MEYTREKKKEYPARIFFRATLTCPSCLQRFRDTSDACPRCGFDAYQVVQRFPYEAPVLEPVMDNAGILDEKWKPDVVRAFDAVQKKFPQIGFYVCTLELDDSVQLPEFGFWMMNACKLQQGQVERDRAWSMLMLIDVHRGLVSLTPGYALEAFIEDSAWEEVLRKLSEQLHAGDYRDFLLDFAEHAERLLGSAKKKVSRKVSQA